MKNNAWQLKNLNIIKTLGVCIKTGCRVICYRGSYIHIEKDAKLKCEAESILHLNRSHYPSNYHNKGLLYLKQRSRMEVSGRVSFGDGMKITLHENSTCQFNGCIINGHCDIGIKSRLYIGAGTLIGDRCSIHDFDGHKIKNIDGEFVEGIADIYIGENVWIGENVTILKGVEIGDNAIIGAGTLVTHSIPASSLVVGNPGYVLRKNVEWKE